MRVAAAPVLRGVKRRAKALAKKGQGSLPAPARSAVRLALALPHLHALADSGLLDVEYYGAQRGKHFTSARAAAQDFLVAGRVMPYAPNPLLEPNWFDPHTTAGGAEPTLRYLASGASRYGVGPLFDEARYLEEHPDAVTHPGRGVGHFLEHATATTPLPVPAGFPGPVPTWGQARARLLALAHERHRLNAVVARRKGSPWTTPEARALVESLSRPPAAPADVDPAAAPRAADVDVVLVVDPRNPDVDATDTSVIAGTLTSLRAQSLKTWRLLAVVPEGSTVPEPLLEAAAADRRVQIAKVAPERTTTPGAARNAVLGLLTADHVAFLDPGARWEAKTLTVLLNAARQGDVAVCCAVDVRDRNGRRRNRVHDGDREQLLWHEEVDVAGLLVQRELLVRLGGFAEDMLAAEGHELALRIERTEAVRFVPMLGARVVKPLAPVAADGPSPVSMATTDHWHWVAIGRHHVDWDAVDAALPQRVPGRVTISMPTYRDWRMTLRAVNAVLANSGDHDVEVVVVDNGSSRQVSSILVSAFLGVENVRILPMAGNLNFSIGSNLGAAVGTGQHVVFLNNDTEVLPGWLDPMLAELEDPQVRGVQPLLLYPDGTIQSAGSLLPGNDCPPFVFLVGFPPEDARRSGPFRLRVVTAAALMMRAEEFAALRGFDPVFVNGQEDVDLCLRAVDRFGGSFSVATDATVLHYEGKSQGRGARIQDNRRLLVERWRGRLDGSDLGVYRQAGFALSHLDYGPPPRNANVVRVPRPVVVRPSRLVESGPAAGLPSLRWALKTAAHPGPRGDGWGDTHFADALMRSLERLGQDVVVDRREARDRPTNLLDDVTLVIRGLEEVAPQPDQVNLLWLISHPEMVDDRELLGFDAAFAASLPWAARKTAEGVPVEALLQCTEPERFHPGLADPSLAHEVLFVGRSRNVFRPIVRDAVEAGLDLTIYGDLWEQFGLASRVRAQYLPYETVGAAYASAGVVLNDHWTDMAAEGFVSNRIFDAVACGARVVSDPVEGLEELFGGSVQVYRGVDDLRRLAGPDGRTQFPDDGQRAVIAEKVAAEHSFDARARRLLDAALAAREKRGWSVR